MSLYSHAELHGDTLFQNRPYVYSFGGQPLTRYQFIAVSYDVTKCLDILGIDNTNYNSHSFRIGAATTLAILVFKVMSFKHQGDGVNTVSYIYSLNT